MTLDQCEEYYEENALGYFYGYAKDDERFTVHFTWGAEPYFRNEAGGTCPDPKLDWFAL